MKLKLYIIALLTLTAVSCTKDIILPEPETKGDKIVTISATISPETRVAYNDTTLKLSWESGDQLLLAGYDGTTYKGSKTFTWSGNGSTFQGSAVDGATTYKAYYPATVTLDGNGNVQLDDTFWQQTQNGDNTTTHLSNKLLLFDVDANPLNQTFNLVLNNSIIRFKLNGIPANVGTLQKLIWTVETAQGAKSMTLNVTGVTFSSSRDSITAFLAFNPTVMQIAPGGKVKITLSGNQSCQWSTTVANPKNYIIGNRYKATVNIGWTLNNPLIYVAEYNVNSAGTGFVTNPTACQGSGFFTWSDAVTKFNTNKNIAGYHLPSIDEWFSIVPKYVSPGYVRFTSSSYPKNVSETVVVQGRSITMSSDFRTTANNVSYALRYKGTDMVSAWRYELIDYNKNSCHMKITSRNVTSSVTIETISGSTYWDSNNENDVIRYFPASGRSNGYGLRIIGFFWSATEDQINPDYACCLLFNNTEARTSNLYSKTNGYTVRLFAD